MEIKIRKMDPYLVKVIDENASRLGVSRNEYLKELIEQVIVNDLLKKKEESNNL